MMNLMEISCEDRRWMELAQDHVQCQDLVLVVLNLQVLLLQCSLYMTEIQKVSVVLSLPAAEPN